jgi:hypothetical protein
MNTDIRRKKTIDLIEQHTTLILPLIELCVIYIGKVIYTVQWFADCQNLACLKRSVIQNVDGMIIYLPFIGCCYCRNGRGTEKIPIIIRREISSTDGYERILMDWPVIDLNIATDTPEARRAPVRKYMLPICLGTYGTVGSIPSLLP